MKLLMLVGIAITSTIAAADEAKPAKPHAKIEMPRPAPELAAMAKDWTGTWACKGKAWMPDGSEHAMTGKLTARLDLNRFWLHESWDGQLDKIGYKQETYTTYDAKAKRWRRVVVNSLGGQMTGTSEAASDNKLDFTLEAISVMGPVMLKEHVDMTDPKAPKLSTERSMDGGTTWQKDYALTCARG
jgi:hypothetical protein